MRLWLRTLVLVGVAMASAPLAAQPGAAAPAPLPVSLLLPALNEPFWSDDLVYQDWRIQEHALTGEFRLVNPSGKCCCDGNYDECRAAFDELKRRQSLPPLSGRAVITLHGLVRSRDQMEGLGRYLAARESGLRMIHSTAWCSS